MIDDRSSDETADLGILTASCPSDALCVKQVLQYGPADEAGVEPGDYLLSLDGKPVSSPEALNKMVATLARDKEVTLKIWRQGKEIQCKAQLASKADSLPKGQDAWLGVMLPNAATVNRISIEDTTLTGTTATAANTANATRPTTATDTKTSTVEIIFTTEITANHTITVAITTGTGIVHARESRSAHILAYTGNDLV
jgi:membrane-associated protease RseP (regulator of RpoE activity)